MLFDLEPEEIPIISMWQPWGQWVGLKWKPIETRQHKRLLSLVGKRIGVHLSLKWDETAIERARPYLTLDQIRQTERFLRIGGSVSYTAFVEAGRLLTTDDEPGALIECSTPRWGLFLRDVKSIPVVPMKGRQGIWYAKLPLPETNAKTNSTME